MDRSVDNLIDLSTGARNAYENFRRDGQLRKFDVQAWVDQGEDEDEKLRRAAILYELKAAGLVQCDIKSVKICGEFGLTQRQPSHRAMETDGSDKSAGEPTSKRAKMETMAPSTTPKVQVNDAKDCPISILPPDILAKVIKYIPIVQWPKLELIPDFQPAILIAWRQLRNVNIQRDFPIRSAKGEDTLSLDKTMAVLKLVLQQLVLRSPFLISLSGIDMPSQDSEVTSNIINALAQFEHLQSITMGDAFLFRKISLENVVEFLETTRSRASLKELRVFRVDRCQRDRSMHPDRFAASLLGGREIRSPLKLEKLTFTRSRYSTIRLDLDNNMDTSRLTDICLLEASIEPEQLISLVERASNLHRIELSFLICMFTCKQEHLQANKNLLAAVASREYLSTLKFGRCDRPNYKCKCMYVKREFMEMLKTIGRRGQLRKLAVLNSFGNSSSNINMDKVLATICEHIPYLRSIKLQPNSDEGASNIVHLRELEQIDFVGAEKLTPNIVREIGQLPRLKCLALDLSMMEYITDQQMSAMECLANATTLIDLRIVYITRISAGILEKWADAFAPNLEILMWGGVATKDLEVDNGLVRLLEKANRLRILILFGRITDRTLEAIAKSCAQLEILGMSDDGEYGSVSSRVTIPCMQAIIDRCPRLRRLGGGVVKAIFGKLQVSINRKIRCDVETEYWRYDLDPSRSINYD